MILLLLWVCGCVNFLFGNNRTSVSISVETLFKQCYFSVGERIRGVDFMGPGVFLWDTVCPGMTSLRMCEHYWHNYVKNLLPNNTLSAGPDSFENDRRHLANSRRTSTPNAHNEAETKLTPFLQTIFSNAFSWMQMFESRLKFHWSLFPRVQLTIFQHWFR